MQLEHATDENWKNEESKVISVRLPKPLYLQFYWFCQRNDLNFNSGLKELIQTHPATTHDA